jgi:hypothetical protein
MAKPAFAQSIPTPSVPEFSVTYVPSTYYVVSTDPYTGANVTDTYLNNTIEVVIKNQPFSPLEHANGTTLSLYYNVEEKGHFSDQWTVYPLFPTAYPASSSDYTVMSFEFFGNYSFDEPLTLGDVPAGGQVDFQVEALIGYYTSVPYYPPGDTEFPEGTTQVFTGETSSWSNTQTITIANGSTSTSISPSTTSNPTPTPLSSNSTLTPTPTLTPMPTQTSVNSAPHSSLLSTTTIATVAIAFLLAIIIFLLFYMRKRRITFSQTKVTPTP